MGAHSRDRSVKPASDRDTWRADRPGKIGNANTRSHPKGWLLAFLCEEGGRKIILFLYIQTRCVDANRRKEQANTTKRGPK